MSTKSNKNGHEKVILKSYFYGLFFTYASMMFVSRSIGHFSSILYMFGSMTMFSVFPGTRKLKLSYYIKSSIIFSLLIMLVNVFMSALLLPFIEPYEIIKISAGAFILCSLGGWLSHYLAGITNNKKVFVFERKGIIARKFFASLIDITNVMIIILALDIIVRLTELAGARISEFFITIALATTLIGYKNLFEIIDKTTPGKSNLKLKIIASPLQIFVRNLNVLVFSALFFLGGIHLKIAYFIILIDSTMFFFGKRLFDLISKTRIEISK